MTRIEHTARRAPPFVIIKMCRRSAGGMAGRVLEVAYGEADLGRFCAHLIVFGGKDMDFHQAEAIRAKLRAGMTTGEAIAGRYREATLDTPESIHRAQLIPTEATESQPPNDAEMMAALLARAESGWAPRKGQL